MTESNGQVVTTDNLAPNPDAPEAEASEEALPPKPSKTRRARRAKKAQADAPQELDTAQLAALGKLTIEAAKEGLSLDEYAEEWLVPMAEAYAAYKATTGG